MEKTLLLFLAFGMHFNAFAQTTLAPDQYEPNNTSTQARFLFDPVPFEPADAPPGYKKVIQANFHDATDDNDWYIMTFTNPNIYQQLPPYWGAVFATTSFGGGRGANSQIFTVTNENPIKTDSLPQKSSDPIGGKTSKWVITPVATMKGVLGALDINFPADIERNILIHQQADNKFLRSVSRNDKTYSIAPGHYNFVLSTVPVENVPIQKGHITRLKAGFLNIVSEGVWNLYDETKEKAYTSGNKPRKLALPVGKYQLKLGGNYYPFVIKDGETVEY